jgi:PAS domain S-box-containing protein
MIRVLIVDDNDANLYLLSSLLQGNGWDVDQARNGAEALTRAAQTPPDIVISDLLMPVMDGYTLLRQWKMDERFQKIPFVVYTATYTEPKDERLALDLGADAFIIKPLEPEPFLARIGEILMKRVRGEMREPRTPEVNEVELRAKYGDVLVHKLEQKIFQLEQLNNTLQQEMARLELTEQELQKSEERYRAIFDNASLGIYIIDEREVFQHCNPALLAMLGYTQQEMRRLTCVDITHPEDIENSRQNRQDLLTGKIANYRLEQRFIRKDGTTLWGEVSVSGIWDSKGRCELVVGLISDMTERKNSLEELLVSERKYTDLLEGANSIIVRIDTHGRITFINKFGREFFGYSWEELEGRPIVGTLIPGKETTGRDLLLMVEDIVQHPENYRNNVNENLKKNGERAWIAWTNLPLHDDSGTVKEIMGIGNDITELRRAQETLRQKEESYLNLFNNSVHGIFVTTPEGRVVDANDAWLRITGYSKKDLLEIVVTNLYSNPAERDLFRMELEKRGFVRDFLVRGKKRDGSEFDCSITANVFRADDGSVLNYQGILRDVTEERRVQKELLAERQQLLSIFNSINQMIYVVDLDSHEILFINAFGKELLGKDPTGSTCFRELHGLETPCSFCPNDKVKALKGKPYQWEFYVEKLQKTFLMLDRMIKWVDGRDVKFEFAMDISDRVKLEKELFEQHMQLVQAQKMEAIGTLAGGIAHDFNNLLTVTVGYSEMLLRGKNPADPGYTAVKQIFDASTRGADLVRNLMAFSRKTPTELKHLNVNDEIRSVVKLLQRAIPKMIDIRLKLSERPGTIMGDAGQFSQVLMNLGINASHAMPDGGELIIETQEIELDEEFCKYHLKCIPGHYVVISVSDTGCGMDKETLQRIFEPFFTTKEQGLGTGLGLATSYGIVKQHGGHITCDSEPGKGTTFKLYFPVVGETQPVEMIPSTAPTVSRGSETILLVDDEKVVQGIAGRILEDAGYTVLAARNGQEALDIYKGAMSRISLVFLDLIMPGMGGKQCLEGLLAINPDVRVIVGSGVTDHKERDDVLALGAMGFVVKPFRMAELLSAVREVLDR